MKQMTVHDAAALQSQSIRLFLAIGEMHSFEILLSNVREADLQSCEPICRKLYITKAATECELHADPCIKFLKPLDGLCDSEYLWHRKLDDHHRRDLGMKHMRSDTALYALYKDGKLAGLSGAYVDDPLRSGIPSFISQKTHGRFQMDLDVEILCSFIGFSLACNGEGSLEKHENFYTDKLEELSLWYSFTEC